MAVNLLKLLEYLIIYINIVKKIPEPSSGSILNINSSYSPVIAAIDVIKSN